MNYTQLFHMFWYNKDNSSWRLMLANVKRDVAFYLTLLSQVIDFMTFLPVLLNVSVFTIIMSLLGHGCSVRARLQMFYF